MEIFVRILKNNAKYFVIGPICAGFFVKYVGFYWAMYGVSISYLIYALLVYFLRKSPEKNIKSVRLFIFFFYSIAEVSESIKAKTYYKNIQSELSLF